MSLLMRLSLVIRATCNNFLSYQPFPAVFQNIGCHTLLSGKRLVLTQLNPAFRLKWYSMTSASVSITAVPDLIHLTLIMLSLSARTAMNSEFVGFWRSIFIEYPKIRLIASVCPRSHTSSIA